MKRRLVRLSKKLSARLRRAAIKAIRAKKAAARSSLAANVYVPVLRRAEAKCNRILHASRRLAA